MKKLLAVLLALMLALGCVAFAEGVDYTGQWVLTGAEANGTALDISAMGLEMSMTLNEDGTCNLIANGVEEIGSWVIEGEGIVVTDAANESNAFVMDEDRLVAEQDGAKMIFSRVGEMAAYADTWVLTSLEMYGMVADPSVYGMELTMELKLDGTCVLSSGEESEIGTWEVTATGIATTDSTGYVDNYTLQDGQLVVEQDDVVVVFTRESEVVETVAATILAGLTEEDFYGEWNFVYAETQGFRMDADLVGLTINFTLEEGKGYAMLTDGESVEEYTGVLELEETEDVGSVMYLMFTDENGEQDGNGMVLFRFDDGTLAWYVVDENNTELFYFCELVVEEEVPAE